MNPGILILQFLMPVLIISFSTAQKVLNVPVPYPTIQKAIDAAASNDTVIVAPGSYREHIDFKTKEITVKSSNGPWVTTINGNQTTLAVVNLDMAEAVLEGFTVTGGLGGGVSCDNGAQVRNNIITGNTSARTGGIHIWSWARITGNIVSGNSSTGSNLWSAGGIALAGYRSRSTIIDNIVINNTTSGTGGGITTRGNAHVTGNVISGNTALANGGGISVADSTILYFHGNIVEGNTAWQDGGGIHVEDSYLEGTSNTLHGNNSALFGGGLAEFNSAVTLVNTLLWDNKAPVGPEAMVSKSTLGPSVLDIQYSVVKGGKASVSVDASSTLVWGLGMATWDPLFVDASRGDLHLRPDSPCKDTGDGTTKYLLGTDFEGDPRINGKEVDVGADEFHPHLYTIGKATPGGTLLVKAIGAPNDPVFWGVSFNPLLRTPPLPVPGVGSLHLKDPYFILSLGALPANGVITVTVPFPHSFPVPQAFPMQALIGLHLSNVNVVNVR